MTENEKKNSAEIEELKQTILECRGLYKGFKIDETTANALALHLHLVNYRKVYKVREETAKEIYDKIENISPDVLDWEEAVFDVFKEYGVEVDE